MKFLKKSLSLLLVMCVAVAGVLQATVKKANAEIVSLYDFHLFTDSSGATEMAIPKTYTVRTMIRQFDSSLPTFKDPSDLFIDDEDMIYVVDTGNNRIVKMDSYGAIVLEITNFVCGLPHDEDQPSTLAEDADDNTDEDVDDGTEGDTEEGDEDGEGNEDGDGDDVDTPPETPVCEHLKNIKTTLNGPKGIFVDEDGDIYVADTGNERIVHFDNEGYYIEQFTKPTDQALAEYPFDVTKLAISNLGEIYVLLQTDFQGFMKLNAKGEYVGNTGMTWTTTNFVEFLWSKLNRQSELLSRSSLVAPPYSNFMIDDENWIYATVITTEENQICKLNSSGTNVYGEVSESGEVSKSSFGRNFYEITDYTTYAAQKYVSNFVDITVDSDGIIYALDDTLGNIFVYDQDGNNLAYFGELGNNRGSFTKPVAIDVLSDGCLAVLDSGTGYVQIFKPTVFCNLMKEGTTLYRDAEYDAARDVWTELLSLDSNYVYAHKAIAKAYFKEKDYVNAMAEYKLAKNKEGYSEAFEAQKQIYTKQYFFLIVLIIAVLIVGVVLGYRRLKKYVDKLHVKVTTWGGDDE